MSDAVDLNELHIPDEHEIQEMLKDLNSFLNGQDCTIGGTTASLEGAQVAPEHQRTPAAQAPELNRSDTSDASAGYTYADQAVDSSAHGAYMSHYNVTPQHYKPTSRPPGQTNSVPLAKATSSPVPIGDEPLGQASPSQSTSSANLSGLRTSAPFVSSQPGVGEVGSLGLEGHRAKSLSRLQRPVLGAVQHSPGGAVRRPNDARMQPLPLAAMATAQQDLRAPASPHTPLRKMLLQQQQNAMSPRTMQRFSSEGGVPAATPLMSSVDRFRSRESSRCASPEPRMRPRDPASAPDAFFTDSDRSASEASSGASSASERSRGVSKARNRRKPRKKTDPGESRLMISSKTCHGCGHVAKARFAACSNVMLGTCRKIFCERCLSKTNTSQQVDLLVAPDSQYICSHCRGTCPSGAQCFYYSGAASKKGTPGSVAGAAVLSAAASAQQSPADLLPNSLDADFEDMAVEGAPLVPDGDSRLTAEALQHLDSLFDVNFGLQ